MSKVDSGFVKLEHRWVRNVHVFLLGIVFHGLARLHQPIIVPL